MRWNWPAMLQGARERGTTSTSTRYADVLHYLELRSESAKGQADSARARSAERSDLVRGRIRAAWGVLPLDGEIDAAKIDTCLNRMRGRADRRTIESELRLMQTESGMPTQHAYASTSRST